MGDYSSILFARPSFLEGAGRIFDFGNAMTEYNRSATATEADQRALWADWCAVGDDLRNAIREYERVEEVKAKETAANCPSKSQ